MAELRVCALYPDLMNIYADRGNLLLLERRCRWRGIQFSLTASSLGEHLDPIAADLYYIGGGQDREQLGVDVERGDGVAGAGQRQRDPAGAGAHVEHPVHRGAGQLLPQRQVGLVAAALHFVPHHVRRDRRRPHRQ